MLGADPAKQAAAAAAAAGGGGGGGGAAAGTAFLGVSDTSMGKLMRDEACSRLLEVAVAVAPDDLWEEFHTRWGAPGGGGEQQAAGGGGGA
jgi:hypothetical protein